MNILKPFTHIPEYLRLQGSRLNTMWNQVNSPAKLGQFAMSHIPQIAGTGIAMAGAAYMGNRDFNEKAREIAEHPEWYYDDYGYGYGYDDGMMKGASLIERRMCGLYSEFLNRGR